MTLIGRQTTDQQLINHNYITGHESYRIPQNNGHYTIQGHSRYEGFWYKSKAHMRLPISD